jgi:hypothetical protein
MTNIWKTCLKHDQKIHNFVVFKTCITFIKLRQLIRTARVARMEDITSTE